MSQNPNVIDISTLPYMHRVNEVAHLLEMNKELYKDEANRLMDYFSAAHRTLKKRNLVDIWGFPPIRAIFVLADYLYRADCSSDPNKSTN